MVAFLRIMRVASGGYRDACGGQGSRMVERFLWSGLDNGNCLRLLNL